MDNDCVSERPDQDALKIGFLGSTEEREAAFACLFNHYHRRIVSFIEQRFPGLPGDMAVDAMTDAFRALYKAIQGGTFDVERPLEPYIFSVARRKAVDQLRKMGRQLPQHQPVDGDEEVVYVEIAAALAGTEVGETWDHVVQEASANEVSAEFRRFLLTLPPVQRQVAQIIADAFPAALPHHEICSEILHRTGERPTSIQVKSALREIRGKFQKLLSARERGPHEHERIPSKGPA